MKSYQLRRSMVGFAAAAMAIGGFTGPAMAQFMVPDGYIGPAFVKLPEVAGNWKGQDHRNWIKLEAHYWKLTITPEQMRRMRAALQGQPSQQGGQPAQGVAGAQGRANAQQGGGGLMRSRAMFNVPGAPRKGEGEVTWSIDKRNPALAGLMKLCQDKVAIPDLAFSVSADLSRRYPQMGPRPAGTPDWFQYQLKNVTISNCPVVAGAVEQALVVKFGDIEWTNWSDPADQVPVTLTPAALHPIPEASGITKSWVVTWIGMANDVADDQCPKMNARPTEADYYAYVPKEEADKERAELASKGGPNYQNGQFGRRGPDRIDVTQFPGIVPEPQFYEPNTRIARGIDLDRGKGPRHKQYVSADGKQTGIDNQLYTATGCIEGWRGHKGFIVQFANGQMRDGQYSLLLEVSGIDNERNDNDVWVTLRYSDEAMAKNSAGDRILSNFSFRVSDRPDYTHFYQRVHGRIVDGVLMTDPAEMFRVNLGVYGEPAELKLQDGQLRLNLMPDGTIKGVLGGYLDWRSMPSKLRSSTVELYFGYPAPGLYYALKRNADGLKNPVTGEYDGISAAYDIEGVPAFVVDARTADVQNQSKASASLK